MALVKAGDSRRSQSKFISVGERLSAPVPAVPLALFRIAFGLLMFASTMRFWLNGWVYDFYVLPGVHFTYLGFGWVTPLSEAGMYAVFGVMLLATLLVTFGLFYRVAMVGFFCCLPTSS